MFCLNCGSKINETAVFCNKCGFKISGSKAKPEVHNDLTEGSEGYKKILNAGTTAEALGWFNLFAGPIMVFAGLSNEPNDYYIIDLIYILTVSIVFVVFGKKLKKVFTATMKDLLVLLWTSIIVVGITLLSGSFSGWLFLLEIYYLFKAKSVLKSIS